MQPFRFLSCFLILTDEKWLRALAAAKRRHAMCRELPLGPAQLYQRLPSRQQVVVHALGGQGRVFLA